MYIRGLIPRNSAELAEAGPFGPSVSLFLNIKMPYLTVCKKKNPLCEYGQASGCQRRSSGDVFLHPHTHDRFL